MTLEVNAMVSATDADVDRLKPNPKGLIVAALKLNTPVYECLFIGTGMIRMGNVPDVRGCLI